MARGRLGQCPSRQPDFGRALGAFGLAGLTAQSSNPAQFTDYLRAVDARTTRVGAATINGAQTTHYHAVVDLDKYPKLFQPAQRLAATRGISALESAIGAMTVDLSDYGPQSVPPPPPSSQAYDLTPLIVKSLKASSRGPAAPPRSQRPFHSGGRFSKNARTPSWMSSVEKAIVS